MRALFLCLLGILFATAADAATGDTVITITYKIKSVRVRPQPIAGVSTTTLHAVLHADGTVDDVIEGKAGNNTKKWELKQRKLGSETGSSARWRVIDANTLQRKLVAETHDYTVKVMVNRKSCKADVSYTLHPGQKEYASPSVQLDRIAHYSEIRTFDVTCKID